MKQLWPALLILCGGCSMPQAHVDPAPSSAPEPVADAWVEPRWKLMPGETLSIALTAELECEFVNAHAPPRSSARFEFVLTFFVDATTSSGSAEGRLVPRLLHLKKDGAWKLDFRSETEPEWSGRPWPAQVTPRGEILFDAEIARASVPDSDALEAIRAAFMELPDRICRSAASTECPSGSAHWSLPDSPSGLPRGEILLRHEESFTPPKADPSTKTEDMTEYIHRWPVEFYFLDRQGETTVRFDLEAGNLLQCSRRFETIVTSDRSLTYRERWHIFADVSRGSGEAR